MSNGMRVIITMGDINGIMDNQVARVDDGLDAMVVDTMNPIISGSITKL